MESKENQPITMAGLCEKMMSSRMPMSDETETAMVELGLRPTVAACIVFSMIQKACKGDTSAAKFLNELSTSGEEEDDGSILNLSALSDSLLYKLADASAFVVEEKPKRKRKKASEEPTN